MRHRGWWLRSLRRSPKATDLRVYTPDHLIAAALQLNSRPRKTLNWDTPAQRLDMLINANK
jgi:IS30 family transposase